MRSAISAGFAFVPVPAAAVRVGLQIHGLPARVAGGKTGFFIRACTSSVWKLDYNRNRVWPSPYSVTGVLAYALLTQM